MQRRDVSAATGSDERGSDLAHECGSMGGRVLKSVGDEPFDYVRGRGRHFFRFSARPARNACSVRNRSVRLSPGTLRA